MSAEVTEKKPRNFTHVPFDRMVCPVPGCATKGGKPQDGTVPGIKRHVRKLHPDVANSLEFPPIRATGADVVKAAEDVAKDSANGLSVLKADQLKVLAKDKGVEGYSTMKKSELLAALST